MPEMPYARMRLRVQCSDGNRASMSIRLKANADYGDAQIIRDLICLCLGSGERELQWVPKTQRQTAAIPGGVYTTSDDVAVLVFRGQGQPVKVLLVGPGPIFLPGNEIVDPQNIFVEPLIAYLIDWLCDEQGQGVTEYLGGHRI